VNWPSGEKAGARRERSKGILLSHHYLMGVGSKLERVAWDVQRILSRQVPAPTAPRSNGFLATTAP
jgi:hypothetical protein